MINSMLALWQRYFVSSIKPATDDLISVSPNKQLNIASVVQSLVGAMIYMNNSECVPNIAPPWLHIWHYCYHIPGQVPGDDLQGTEHQVKQPWGYAGITLWYVHHWLIWSWGYCVWNQYLAHPHQSCLKMCSWVQWLSWSLTRTQNDLVMKQNRHESNMVFRYFTETLWQWPQLFSGISLSSIMLYDLNQTQGIISDSSGKISHHLVCRVIWIKGIYLFQLRLRQKYSVFQVWPDRVSNIWPPDYNSAFHVLETEVLTTWLACQGTIYILSLRAC